MLDVENLKEQVEEQEKSRKSDMEIELSKIEKFELDHLNFSEISEKAKSMVSNMDIIIDASESTVRSLESKGIAEYEKGRAANIDQNDPYKKASDYLLQALIEAWRSLIYRDVSMNTSINMWKKMESSLKRTRTYQIEAEKLKAEKEVTQEFSKLFGMDEGGLMKSITDKHSEIQLKSWEKMENVVKYFMSQMKARDEFISKLIEKMERTQNQQIPYSLKNKFEHHEGQDFSSETSFPKQDEEEQIETEDIVVSSKEILKCDVCGDTFMEQNVLDVHNSQHDSCPFCKKLFKSHEDLKTHLGKEHQEPNREEQKLLEHIAPIAAIQNVEFNFSKDGNTELKLNKNEAIVLHYLLKGYSTSKIEIASGLEYKVIKRIIDKLDVIGALDIPEKKAFKPTIYKVKQDTKIVSDGSW